MGVVNPAWLSLLLAILIAGVQAWTIVDRQRYKRQREQLDIEAQFQNRLPLAGRVLSLEQAIKHESDEWSKKLSELTIHLVGVDLSIKTLDINNLSIMKDITRLELDVRALRDRSPGP